jgi:hypothetical protein
MPFQSIINSKDFQMHCAQLTKSLQTYINKKGQLKKHAIKDINKFNSKVNAANKLIDIVSNQNTVCNLSAEENFRLRHGALGRICSNFSGNNGFQTIKQMLDSFNKSKVERVRGPKSISDIRNFRLKKHCTICTANIDNYQKCCRCEKIICLVCSVTTIKLKSQDIKTRKILLSHNSFNIQCHECFMERFDNLKNTISKKRQNIRTIAQNSSKLEEISIEAIAKKNIEKNNRNKRFDNNTLSEVIREVFGEDYSISIKKYTAKAHPVRKEFSVSWWLGLFNVYSPYEKEVISQSRRRRGSWMDINISQDKSDKISFTELHKSKEYIDELSAQKRS